MIFLWPKDSRIPAQSSNSIVTAVQMSRSILVCLSRSRQLNYGQNLSRSILAAWHIFLWPESGLCLAENFRTGSFFPKSCHCMTKRTLSFCHLIILWSRRLSPFSCKKVNYANLFFFSISRDFEFLSMSDESLHEFLTSLSFAFLDFIMYFCCGAQMS